MTMVDARRWTLDNLPYVEGLRLLDHAVYENRDAIGRYTVSEADCAGHFGPGLYVFPLVKSLEMMYRPVAYAYMRRYEEEGIILPSRFSGEITGPILPGDEVWTHHKLNEMNRDGGHSTFEMTVGTSKILHGDFAWQYMQPYPYIEKIVDDGPTMARRYEHYRPAANWDTERVNILPHGPEFRFLDAYAKEDVPDQAGRGKYEVTWKEPERLFRNLPPIFPPMYLFEGLAQTGAVYMLEAMEQSGAIPVFSGRFNGEFGNTWPGPGDIVETYVTCSAFDGLTGEAYGRVYSESWGTTHFSGGFGFQMQPRERLIRMIDIARRKRKPRGTESPPGS